MKNIARWVSCVVIVSLAGAKAVAAPLNSPEYTVNGSTVIGSGSNPTTAYFLDTTEATYNVTVNAGANLGNTTGQAQKSEIQFYSGSVTNYGTLNTTSNDGDAIFLQGNATITNAGVINSARHAVDIDSEQGGGANTVTITNSGSMITSGQEAVYITANNTGGSGTNSNTVTISNSGYIEADDDHGIQIDDLNNEAGTGTGAATNTVTINNSGIINASEHGIYLNSGGNEGNSGNGANVITVNNSGVITANSTGIEIDDFGNESNTGSGINSNTLTISNSGQINSFDEAIYVDLYNADNSSNGTNTVTINNTGSLIPSEDEGIYLELENGGNSGSGTNSNTVLITNSGVINANDEAIDVEVGNDSNSSNGTNVVTINNKGALTSNEDEGIYASLENSGNTGTGTNSNTLTITNSGAINANDEGIDVDGLDNDHNGGIGSNSLTITNTGSITTTFDEGIYVSGVENAHNSGSGINTNTIAISNSALITASDDDGIYVETENHRNTGNGSNSVTVSLSASSVINAADDGVYIEATNDHNNGSGTDSNTVTVTNNGSITSQYSDGVEVALENDRSAGDASNSITFFNTGNIQSSDTGVYLHNDESHVDGTSADSISFSNYGTITSTNDHAVDLENNSTSIFGTASSASIAALNTGTINGQGGDGLYVYNERRNGTATVTNYGNISGAEDGVELDSHNATFTTYGGSITGGNNAIELDHNDSSVTVVGRSNIQGTIEGNGHSANTLTFQLAGVSAAQAQVAQNAINEAAGGPGNFTVAGLTYNFDGFNAVNLQTVSFGNSVDPGLRDLGSKLDNLTTALPESMDAVYTLGFSNPEAALNSLSGREFLDAFTQIGLSNATEFGATADNRANALRQGSTGLDFSGLSISPNTMIASLGNMETTLNHMSSSIFGGTTMSDSVDHKSMISETSSRWGVWAAGTVTFADESNTNTAPGYNAVSGSPTFGIDYRVCPDLVVGSLFNYTNGDVNFADGSTLNTDSYLGGVYVDWAHKGFFVNGLAAGGMTDYSQNRNTLGGGTAHGAPSGGEELAVVTGGYDFKFSGFIVSPEAGLQYTHLGKDAFSESGAGAFDLNVGEQDVNSLRTKLGATFSRPIDCSGTKIVPQINGFWYHECLNNSNGVANSLPGAPGVGSFVVQTNPEGRDFALVGAGVTMTPHAFQGNLSLFVNYNAQVGQSNFIAQTVDGGLKIGF